MVVLEHHPNHTDLDMDKITLKDVSCTLNDLGQFNATHLWMKAPFDSCMTEHNTTEDTITYFNSIVAETRASGSRGSVSAWIPSWSGLVTEASRESAARPKKIEKWMKTIENSIWR